MKYKILTSVIGTIIIGFQILSGFSAPTESPVSTIPTWWVFSQFFDNISKTGSAANPIIIGYNSLSGATDPMMPIFSSAEVFITNYLKTIGPLPWDNVLNGFTSTGNVMASSMTTLVKGYLNGKNANPNYAITGYDVSGNILQSRDVGYWMGSIPSWIEYINGNVSIGGSIKLFGNATSKNATLPNHLTTKGQIDTQLNEIKTTLNTMCISDGSCNAATPACGTTTTGVDNCGNSCSKIAWKCVKTKPVSTPAKPGCIPHECDAIMPTQCWVTNMGWDGCWNLCFKGGISCN